MNQPPPPPPPPPQIAATAPPTQSCFAIQTGNGSKTRNESAEEEMRRVLWEQVGGMQIAVNWTPLRKPILQVGPVCGLIALVEAAEILGFPEPNPDELLQTAIGRGMTKSGEMFRAEDMRCLAENLLGCEAEVLETNDLERTREILLKHFLEKRNAAVLIPYDADYNHGPSLRKGHAAHWAVLHGVAVTVPSSSPRQEDGIVIVENTSSELFSTAVDETIFLLAHHGKSVRLQVWSFLDLIKSNQNLKEVSPKILADNNSSFVYGNIELDLCSKLVILRLRN